MKYYKIVKSNEIVGVITSNDFIAYSPITDCYMSVADTTGEYAVYQSQLYRDSWMKPIQLTNDYQEASIITINKNEYDAFIAAIQENEIANVPTEEEEAEELLEQEIIDYTTLDPINDLTIDFIKQSKISEMSRICRETIENGFDLEIQGQTYHFSLTTQDQLNLMSLSTLAQTQSLIPYHADGEETTFYTANEIYEIAQTATQLKIYNTAYYNSLKNYINNLETIEEISAITYGIPIPDEYKSDVLKVLE